MISLKVLIDCGHEGSLGHGPNHSIHLLAVLKDHNRWDAANAILSGDLRALIRVQFVASQLALVLCGKLVNKRSDHSAGTAPGSPEVHEHGDIAVQDETLEGSISDRPSSG